VSKYFAETLELNDISLASTIFSRITANASSVINAQAELDAITPTTSVNPNEELSNSAKTALNSIDEYMKKIIADDLVPGAVLSIAKGQQVIYSRAFGVTNVETQTPVTTDTLFHIGSTHKALTSFMIATLVDENVLNWDTKAQDIYSGFNSAYASEITIRQLLDMTSGLPDFNYPFNDVRSLFEELPYLEEELHCSKLIAPGTEYEYSNASVSIAAYLAVLAKRKFDNGQLTDNDLNNLHSDYQQLLKERVLEPLAMNNSYLYVNDARNTGRMSHSHQLDRNQFIVSSSIDEIKDIFAPAGGLKSSVNDMIKYMIVEGQQGITTTGNRLVSIENMLVRQTLSPGPAEHEEYGLGLQIGRSENGIRYIGHTGSYDNFNSIIGLYPDQKITFVLLTNGDAEDILSVVDYEIKNTIAKLVNHF
jgi:CubicO group peptidase (beta-lactamase class C family)